MPVTMPRLTPLFRSNWPKWAAALSIYGLCSSAQALPFDIPEQDLATALMHFSQQSGLNVVRDGALSGLRSTAISGDYSQAQALRLLLSATGLEFESIPSGMRLINPQADKEEDAYLLPATDIVDTKNPVFDKYKTPEIKYEVTREQLDRVPYSRIGDIFNGVPGVASANSANGAGLEIHIRGLQGMGRVKTLVDGSMQTTNTYRGYSGSRDSTFIDPDLIGGIDIKKGPDAGPQGAGVIGGIVNMRTINASDIITDPDKNWGIQLKGMYGNNVASGDIVNISYQNLLGNGGKREIKPYAIHWLDRKSGRGKNVYNCYHPDRGGCDHPKTVKQASTIGGSLPERNASGSLALAFRPLEYIDITLAYAERESGNYHAGKHGKSASTPSNYNYIAAGGEVMNTSHRSDSWLAKSKFYFGENHSLELSHIKYRAQSGYYQFLQRPIDWQDHLRDVETNTYALQYIYQTEIPWLNIRSNLWKSRANFETPYSLSAGSMTNPKKQEQVIDSFGGELWNSSTIDFTLGELLLKYGVSFSQEKSSGYTIDIRDLVRTDVAVNGKRSTYGAFSQGNWEITSWLSVNAGVQYTKGKLEENAPVPPQPSWASAPYARLPVNRQHAIDPSYGFSITPHDSVQLFAQWSHGSRMPNVNESLQMKGNAAPNPDLKMEKAKNFEYGVNLLFESLLSTQDKLGIKFSKFENKYNDYIVRVHRGLLGGIRFPPPYDTTSYTYSNIDSARYKGYEISADYDNGWLFGNFGMTYFDNIKYCYINAENIYANPVVLLPKACYKRPPSSDYTGSYIPPRQEKNAGFGVRLLDQKLILGATMKTSTKSLPATGGTIRVKSALAWDNYEVYDIYGQLKLTKNLEMGFSIENVTDKFYAPSHSNYTDGLPAPGRTARGMFTFRF